MARLTGGEALAKTLVREGARVVFGLPGVQLYGAVAAIRDEPGLRFVTTRHEQATTYMADGYARAGGGFGVALVVPGPGLFNAAAGLSTAYAASSPVMLVAGQIPAAYIGRRVGVLHEVDDQLDALRGVTKWRQAIRDAKDVAPVVHQAVVQLRSGRPRPVAIEIPPDTLDQETDVELIARAPSPRPVPAAADLDRSATMLLAAARPVVYAGGGVHASDAHGPLAALAAHLEAGVIQTGEGKGAVSDASDLSLGAALWKDSPLRAYLDAADVVLAVGTRLAVAGLQPAQQVIQIDIDPAEIGRNHAKTAGLVGDARATLEALLARLRQEPPRPSRREERERARAAVAAVAAAAENEPPAAILRSLRAGIPEDAIVVPDMTQVGYHTRPFWPVYHPRTYFTSSYSGNLGFAFPTALGAKVARPDRAVVALVGDGGFLFNAQELATAAQQGINVVTVVFNDQAYGNVARDLDEDWGGKFASELHNPDFVRLAESFGVTGWRATTPEDLGDMVRRGLDLDRPVLIEMAVGRMQRPAFFGPRRRLPRFAR
jgi:acetolactate synthase-1/2/3 large subunit